jgi:hypothetical protein
MKMVGNQERNRPLDMGWRIILKWNLRDRLRMGTSGGFL